MHRRYYPYIKPVLNEETTIKEKSVLNFSHEVFYEVNEFNPKLKMKFIGF